MPYSGADDDKLPDRIKEMPAAMRRRWVGAFNGSYEQCQEDGGDDCEGTAMRIANSSVDNDRMMSMSDLAQYTYNGVKVTASGRRTSTRDDKKYMRTVMIDGKERIVHYGDPDMPMRRNNDEARQNFVARHNCSEKKDPTAPGFWACHDWENTSEMSERDNFLFFDLQGLITGRPFPGFAPGSFIDMAGREIELKAKDLQAFIANTLNKIKEFQARGMPGLPIDARKHDKGDAAGWITGAEAGEVIDSNGESVPVISILAEWTKLGAELIRDKMQTNFSPTVDLENKAIVGGSLTNWPASVDKNGVPLFTAVELAQGIHYLQQQMPVDDDDKAPSWYERLKADLASVFKQESNNSELASGGPTASDKVIDEVNIMDFKDLTEAQQTALLSQARDKVLAELAPEGGNSDEAIARIKEQLNLSAFADVADLGKAREALLTQMQAALRTEYERMQAQSGQMLAQMMAEIKREQHIAEFAQRVTGGDEKARGAIPVGYEEIEAFLGSLNDNQRAAAESIFERTVKEGLNDFSTHGHGRRTAAKQPVPDFAVEMLKQAVETKTDLHEFFALAGLGSADDYDLSKFVSEANNG